MRWSEVGFRPQRPMVGHGGTALLHQPLLSDTFLGKKRPEIVSMEADQKLKISIK